MYFSAYGWRVLQQNCSQAHKILITDPNISITDGEHKYFNFSNSCIYQQYMNKLCIIHLSENSASQC